MSLTDSYSSSSSNGRLESVNPPQLLDMASFPEMLPMRSLNITSDGSRDHKEQLAPNMSLQEFAIAYAASASRSDETSAATSRGPRGHESGISVVDDGDTENNESFEIDAMLLAQQPNANGSMRIPTGHHDHNHNQGMINMNTNDSFSPISSPARQQSMLSLSSPGINRSNGNMNNMNNNSDIMSFGLGNINDINSRPGGNGSSNGSGGDAAFYPNRSSNSSDMGLSGISDQPGELTLTRSLLDHDGTRNVTRNVTENSRTRSPHSLMFSSGIGVDMNMNVNMIIDPNDSGGSGANSSGHSHGHGHVPVQVQVPVFVPGAGIRYEDIHMSLGSKASSTGNLNSMLSHPGTPNSMPGVFPPHSLAHGSFQGGPQLIGGRGNGPQLLGMNAMNVNAGMVGSSNSTGSNTNSNSGSSSGSGPGANGWGLGVIISDYPMGMGMGGGASGGAGLGSGPCPGPGAPRGNSIPQPGTPHAHSGGMALSDYAGGGSASGPQMQLDYSHGQNQGHSPMHRQQSSPPPMVGVGGPNSSYSNQMGTSGPNMGPAAGAGAGTGAGAAGSGAVAAGTGASLAGGIGAALDPNMSADRLIALTKSMWQHKEATEMLLKAAQTQVADTRKKCDELTTELEETKRALIIEKQKSDRLTAAMNGAGSSPHRSATSAGVGLFTQPSEYAREQDAADRDRDRTRDRDRDRDREELLDARREITNLRRMLAQVQAQAQLQNVRVYSPRGPTGPGFGPPPRSGPTSPSLVFAPPYALSSAPITPNDRSQATSGWPRNEVDQREGDENDDSNEDEQEIDADDDNNSEDEYMKGDSDDDSKSQADEGNGDEDDIEIIEHSNNSSIVCGRALKSRNVLDAGRCKSIVADAGMRLQSSITSTSRQKGQSQDHGRSGGGGYCRDAEYSNSVSTPSKDSTSTSTSTSNNANNSASVVTSKKLQRVLNYKNAKAASLANDATEHNQYQHQHQSSPLSPARQKGPASQLFIDNEASLPGTPAKNRSRSGGAGEDAYLNGDGDEDDNGDGDGDGDARRTFAAAAAGTGAGGKVSKSKPDGPGSEHRSKKPLNRLSSRDRNQDHVEDDGDDVTEDFERDRNPSPPANAFSATNNPTTPARQIEKKKLPLVNHGKDKESDRDNDVGDSDEHLNDSTSHAEFQFQSQPQSPQRETAAPGSSGQICRFFKKGHCMFGNKCLNIHAKIHSSAPGGKDKDKDRGKESPIDDEIPGAIASASANSQPSAIPGGNGTKSAPSSSSKTKAKDRK